MICREQVRTLDTFHNLLHDLLSCRTTDINQHKSIVRGQEPESLCQAYHYFFEVVIELSYTPVSFYYRQGVRVSKAFNKGEKKSR